MPKQDGLTDRPGTRRVNDTGSRPAPRKRSAPVPIQFPARDEDWPRVGLGGRPDDDWGLEDWTTPNR
jgi:hypothetical protein